MDRECEERRQKIIAGFRECRNAFTAIGDETRQLILLVLLESDLSGIRVGEIAEKAHLTRPSVSHHLQLLKASGIVAVRREERKLLLSECGGNLLGRDGRFDQSDFCKCAGDQLAISTIGGILMVLYFSGTGNSRYVAKRIGREIDDEVSDLFERIRSHDNSELRSESPWVVVVPTYAWRIPTSCRNGWSIRPFWEQGYLFCDDLRGSIGNAGKHLRQLCRGKTELPGLHGGCHAGKVSCDV